MGDSPVNKKILNASNRDASFIKLIEDIYLVVACDSCGAVGEKSLDVVKVPPYIVGRFTSRVALMETFSVGACPKALTAAICNEPNPTGEGMLAGIKDELDEVCLDVPIVISTEKNMETSQTGLGITVVGICKENELRVNATQPKDKLYCLGKPKVGNEVFLDDPEIASTLLIKKLLEAPNVHDIVPVGSKGIKNEAEMLASSLELNLKWKENLPVDIKKTAGPATCVLVTCAGNIDISCTQPVFFLAEFDK